MVDIQPRRKGYMITARAHAHEAVTKYGKATDSETLFAAHMKASVYASLGDWNSYERFCKNNGLKLLSTSQWRNELGI